ncbi:MAG: DUF5665 domain-containing protein [Bacillota bacterium]|nr:DUF5665 domain-containing protein [Bacillota bacterium]
MRFLWQKKQTAALAPTEPPPAADGQAAAQEEDQPAQLSDLDIKMLHKLAVTYENTVEYLNLRQNPLRMTWVNFLAGVAKGLGFAFGFTVLAFLALYILKSLSILNLPLIGDFISDLLLYIEDVRRIG